MKRILYIGLDPHTLDFSQPGFAPGLTAEKVAQGIQAELIHLKNLGYDTSMHFLDTDVMNLASLEQRFGSVNYDGVLIGAGIRIPPANLPLFERIINTIHDVAPGTKIIFNTTPGDSAEAIRRWL